MEFAAAALSSIGSAFGAGGATAGTTAAAAGTAAAGATASAGLSSLFSTSTLATILSGGATILGAMSARDAGRTQSDSLLAQAQDIKSQAVDTQIEGNQRRGTIRDQFLKTVAEQNVAYAASGVDLSFGTPVTAQRQAANDASAALATDQASEDMNVSRIKTRAGMYQRLARDARRSGNAKAFGMLVDGGADILARG